MDNTDTPTQAPIEEDTESQAAIQTVAVGGLGEVTAPRSAEVDRALSNEAPVPEPVKRGPGRPKGSKTKRSASQTSTATLPAPNSALSDNPTKQAVPEMTRTTMADPGEFQLEDERE